MQICSQAQELFCEKKNHLDTLQQKWQSKQLIHYHYGNLMVIRPEQNS